MRAVARLAGAAAVLLAASGAAAGAPAAAEAPVAVRVVVVGAAHDPRGRALEAAARAPAGSGTRVEVHDPATGDRRALPAAVQAMLAEVDADPTPRAYVCTASACSLPTSDPARLGALVERLGRAP
jgi:uncharacterized protein YyaL (SSP411 family)